MASWQNVLLVLAVILVIAVALKIMELSHSNVVASDATQFVLEDLRSNHPDADIAIMNVTPEYNEQGKPYFVVKAKVTEDALSPCPQRSNIYYNYPVQNFVVQPPDVITGSNCMVCTAGICNIAFPEEAIIASHTFNGTRDVQRYVDANPSAIPTVTENADSWLVKWDAVAAGNYYTVKINRNGAVLSVQSVPKS